MSIFMLAGCMAAVALISAFAGYGIGVNSTTAGEAAVFKTADAEPDTETLEAEPFTASAAPEVQIIKPPPETSDTIAIPGFKKLTAKGQTLRASAITNPGQNACYFVVTLIMPGGAELYRSTYLAPGQSLGDVEMAVQLEPKVYEGVTAKYSCYTIGDLKPLNGGGITFTLEVLQ